MDREPHKPMTAAEFDALTPHQKGYAVYMAGDRDDQPNIPSTYVPDPDEAADFAAGQRQGVIEAIDGCE